MSEKKEQEMTGEDMLALHYGYEELADEDARLEFIEKYKIELDAMHEWAEAYSYKLTKHLRQDIKDLVFQNNSLQDYCRELEQKVQTLKAMHSAELKMRQEAEEIGEGAAKYHSELKLALDQVGKELLRAKTLFPSFFVNQHEAYAVILEEVDELWAEIKKNQHDYDLEAQRKEAIQAAAMLIRLIVELL